MSHTDILYNFKYPQNFKGWQLLDITSYIKVPETKQLNNKQIFKGHFFVNLFMFL